MSVQALHSIYQLKIGLNGAKPPIWRRVLVADSIHLSELHLIIQATMGWYNCHLHQFSQGSVLYGEVNDDFDDFGMDIQDETRVRLKEVLKAEKQYFRYDYDFGDNWNHKITLEKILPFDTQQTLPQCIKAKRACPPEDCGGIWGYEGMLETLENPDDPEYEELLDWLGGEIDPEYVDIDAINRRLAG